MRAWAVVENGKPLQEIELPTPEPKGTEVLLEVTHCGVCHSDLHIWEGYYDIGGGKQDVAERPRRGAAAGDGARDRRPGGEARPGAKGVKVGDLRIVFPWVGCGHARVPGGRGQHVPHAAQLGVYQTAATRTHVIAPHPRHLVDPGTVDPAVAATYACSGITVYSAIRKVMPHAAGRGDRPGRRRRARAERRSRCCKALEHQRSWSVDISAEKREAALKAGAHKVVDGSGEGVAKRIIEACGGPVLAVIDLVNGTQPRASPSMRCARAASWCRSGCSAANSPCRCR